jgi:hypothetical protein
MEARPLVFLTIIHAGHGSDVLKCIQAGAAATSSDQRNAIAMWSTI